MICYDRRSSVPVDPFSNESGELSPFVVKDRMPRILNMRNYYRRYIVFLSLKIICCRNLPRSWVVYATLVLSYIWLQVSPNLPGYQFVVCESEVSVVCKTCQETGNLFYHESLWYREQFRVPLNVLWINYFHHEIIVDVVNVQDGNDLFTSRNSRFLWETDRS